MAIKINNTTVINDSRSLENITGGAVLGIQSAGVAVGSGVTTLNFIGTGNTFAYNVGTKTLDISIQSGGGGSIGIGSSFPVSSTNGNLFYHIDYGRTFVYYDEVALGIGATSVWVDAAPFNQGGLFVSKYGDNMYAGLGVTTGSSSSPSVYFNGYSNLGFYSPAANEFGVVVLGTQRLNVNSGGINVTGVATATSFRGSAQVGVATGGVYLGLTTQFNFVGSGITITPTYDVTSGITTLTFTAGASSGGGTSGVSDGVVFNAGITSIASARLVGTGSTVLTLPSTAGKEYIIYSINASNIAVGNTEVNVIGAFDFNGGERSYFAYNIPIPTGTAVELLKQPQVLNPSDRITMRGTDINRVGSDTAVEVYISYQEKTSTSYFGIGIGTVGITTTAPVGVYTSTGSGSVLQSIRLANRTDTGDYPVSVTITSGVNTTYLVDDLIIPKYGSVEILDNPKAIKTNDVVNIIVDQLQTIDVQISGIKV